MSQINRQSLYEDDNENVNIDWFSRVNDLYFWPGKEQRSTLRCNENKDDDENKNHNVDWIFNACASEQNASLLAIFQRVQPSINEVNFQLSIFNLSVLARVKMKLFYSLKMALTTSENGRCDGVWWQVRKSLKALVKLQACNGFIGQRLFSKSLKRIFLVSP